MNKQTFMTISVLALIALGALWYSSSADTSSGSAIAAESESSENSADAAPVDPWAVRCDEREVEGGEGETVKHCEIVQRLFVKETGKRFAEFAIGYPKDAGGDARGVVILPLGVLLEQGVKMQVDEGRVYQFSFRYCGQGGCVAVIKLSEGIITEMKKGNAAAIQFMSANGQAINLPITLKGYTKAITELPKS